MQIGFMGLLGILFIALKLLGVITWSWFWVTAPLWVELLLLLYFIRYYFSQSIGVEGVNNGFI